MFIGVLKENFLLGSLPSWRMESLKTLRYTMLAARLSKFLINVSASWSLWQRKCEYVSKFKSSLSSKQSDKDFGNWSI
jgi:hypothetical protein